MTTAPSFFEAPSESAGAVVLSGTEAASQVVDEIREMMDRSGLVPGLAVVLVGNDPASAIYVANKGRRADRLGFTSRQIGLPADTSKVDLLAIIDELNNDASVHGILVQLPLPAHLAAEDVMAAISPEKDVDGFNAVNVGRMTIGSLHHTFVPCTPLGCMRLIRQAIGTDLKGLHAVVIGKSNIVGRPMASLLMQAECTVTVVHVHTRQIETLCRQADILVAAAGVPSLVKGHWIKPGAVVIDVGINRVMSADGRSHLVGDVDFHEASKAASFITPVPGGVGPMTIAMLMHNTYTAAARAVQTLSTRRAIAFSEVTCP
jgi:methylenetetrahydrofolate dehydrogenase (NADP+)/methenyltetrahydrofolate cyclohydrolase